MTEVRFRPSSIDRIILCPPSVEMSRGLPRRPSGDAAREGSAAHRVAELCLKSGQNAEEYVDRGIDIEDGRGLIFLDDGDCASVQVYIDHARRRMAIPGSVHHVEYRLSMKGHTSDPLIDANGGTADLLTLDWLNQILYVDDLKFGRGVKVYGDSAQLKNYGLMAMLTFPHPQGWKKIVTTIIQPRIGDTEAEWIKSVEHEPYELQEFLFKMYDAFAKSQDPTTPLNPGEKQCLFCDGKSRPCPAIARRALEVGRKVFGPVTPAMLGDPIVEAPKVSMELDKINLAEATVEQLAAWKEHEEMINSFFKAVSERMAHMLTGGATVPGWKMVSRSGNRKWKDDKDIRAELQALGVPVDKMYAKPKLLGPAPIEKLLSAAQKKELAELFERPDGSPTLVRDTDSRGALPGVFTKAPQLPLNN